MKAILMNLLGILIKLLKKRLLIKIEKYYKKNKGFGS